MKFYQSGRSMVEMLGVLAIIGVLSVGAISGYSKAMMKYKLNKQITQISEILNTMIIEHDKLLQSYGASQDRVSTPYFIKAGLAPTEMISENGKELYDALGSQVIIYYNSNNGYGRLNIWLNQYAMESCLNLYDLAKANSSALWWLYFYKGNTGLSIGSGKGCTKNNLCINNIDPLLIKDKVCAFCKDGTRCNISFVIK